MTDYFGLIIGFALGFLVGIMLKWVLRFKNFIKQEAADKANPLAKEDDKPQ